jgi:hypothetical protein
VGIVSAMKKKVVKTIVLQFGQGAFLRILFEDKKAGKEIFYSGTGYLVENAAYKISEDEPAFTFQFIRNSADWNKRTKVRLVTEYKQLDNVSIEIGNNIVLGIIGYEQDQLLN